MNIPAHLKVFSTALKKLKYLHILVNSENLPNNYDKVIDDFTASWSDHSNEFAVPVTLKIDIICDHLADYFNITGRRLRNVMDELTEVMHQYCHK